MSLLWTTAASTPGEYFHGTTQTFKPGDHITPASQHGKGVAFPNMTSREHAYATPDESTAWHYAEAAWNNADIGGTHPKVYRVKPLGHTEDDPTHDQYGASRGTFTGDVRSKHGFEVVGEQPMPEHMGKPEDWR